MSYLSIHLSATLNWLIDRKQKNSNRVFICPQRFLSALIDIRKDTQCRSLETYIYIHPCTYIWTTRNLSLPGQFVHEGFEYKRSEPWEINELRKGTHHPDTTQIWTLSYLSIYTHGYLSTDCVDDS